MNMSISNEQHRKNLSDFKNNKINNVKWTTANDKRVCQACENRNNKIFSISEAVELLKTTYCESKWCRCAFVAHLDS